MSLPIENINVIKISDTVEENNNKVVLKNVKIDYTKINFTEEEKIAIRNEVDIIKQQYPNYIPIIVRTRKNDKSIILKKSKFLVTNEITLAQFLTILRKKISDIKSNESIFLLIDNTLMPITLTLSTIYKEKKILIQICFLSRFVKKIHLANKFI